MIPPGSLRLVDDEEADVAPEAPVEAKPAPKVFVRTLQTPPGLPWEQSRTAELDARLSSPLPAGDVVYQLRRLDTWRPGSPARFAAFYVLARDVGGRLETQAQVDGRDVRVVFESAQVAADRAKRLGGIGLAAAVIAFAFVLVVSLALGRRAELEGRLASAEQQASAKLSAASARARLKLQDQTLRAWPDKGAPMSEILADLGWISGAKAGGAQIDGVHWDHGLLAVEAPGLQPPLVVFGDRKLRRSAKPIRPGVFLWAVDRQEIKPALPAPIAATPLPIGEAR